MYDGILPIIILGDILIALKTSMLNPYGWM